MTFEELNEIAGFDSVYAALGMVRLNVPGERFSTDGVTLHRAYLGDKENEPLYGTLIVVCEYAGNFYKIHAASSAKGKSCTGKKHERTYFDMHLIEGIQVVEKHGLTFAETVEKGFGEQAFWMDTDAEYLKKFGSGSYELRKFMEWFDDFAKANSTCKDFLENIQNETEIERDT